MRPVRNLLLLLAGCTGIVAGQTTDVPDWQTAAGGKMTFNVSCKEGKGTTTTSNDVTYGPDWYTNVSKAKSDGGTVSQKVSAKRIGDCKK